MSRAIGVLLVALLVHNVALFVRNQRTFDRQHRVARQRDTLREAAAEGTHVDTRGRTAMLYLVREGARGATLVVPQSFQRFAWWLEHVSRVKVEVVRHAPAVDAALVEQATASVPLRLRGERTVPLYFRFQPGTARYAIGQTGEAFILAPAPE